jgi:hypothetical protein
MGMKCDKRHHLEGLEPRREDNMRTYLKESELEGVKCMILFQNRKK